MTTPPASPAPGPKKASPAVLALFAVILLFAIGLRIKAAADLRNPVEAEATVSGRTFSIEVADNAAKREKGLGDRDSLPMDHGMYFPFETVHRWSFWMKDMRFPIDIIWIRDGKVVDIHHDVQPPKTLPLDIYSPIEAADAVLELNAGTAAAIGLRIGDPICLGTCPPDLPEAPAITLETMSESASGTAEASERAENASGTGTAPDPSAP